MQKISNNWSNACDELNKKLRQYTNGPRALSVESKIDYYAARRFLKFGAHNRGKNIEKLCAFFKISTKETAKIQKKVLLNLNEVVRDVWDGTEAHAQLITKLVQSTKSFRIEGRAKK